jgi:LysM repeat protein
MRFSIIKRVSMVRSLLIIMGIMLGAAGVQAQDTLQVQGAAPDLYLMHTVKKGETFYSLSRAYSVPPKEIAAQNNLNFDGGLQLGQSVKVPLNKGNFVQSGDAAGGHPVYHKVSEKETLYRISVNYNKVPLDNIRHWNNLTGDGVQKDSYLIVGYVKGAANGAVIASHTPAAPPPATIPASAPAPTPASPAPAPPVTETTTVVKNNPAPSSVLTPAPPVVTPAPPVTSNTESDSNSASETHASVPAPAPAASTPPPPAPSGSSFEQIYSQQTSGKKPTTEKGPGSWFKSNAGAGKYYALHNSASRGTIIKVTNPLNGKSIYAKVLEAIPQMKQNAGLIIKLSDSAIEALGTNETKFYCELSYEN